MNPITTSPSHRRRAVTALIAVSCVALLGAGGMDKKKPDDSPAPLTVPKATCGPNDHPETGLQGQVSAALRASGFKGFNCNLELVGQSKGDGSNWQTTQFVEGRKRCAYYGTAFSTANRTQVGVPVVISPSPLRPRLTAF